MVLAALTNALRVVEKELTDVPGRGRPVAGAAGTAIVTLLIAAGRAATSSSWTARAPCAPATTTLSDAHRELAGVTNPRRVTRRPARAASRGADVFIGVSAPGILQPEWIADMADKPVVFALANPDPEVDPAEAEKYAAVVASGRSDYPNQINNVLAFPGVFRGLLDARASDITIDMLLRAADGDRARRARRGAQPELHHPDRLQRRGAEGGRRGDPRRPTRRTESRVGRLTPSTHCGGRCSTIERQAWTAAGGLSA